MLNHLREKYIFHVIREFDRYRLAIVRARDRGIDLESARLLERMFGGRKLTGTRRVTVTQ